MNARKFSNIDNEQVFNEFKKWVAGRRTALTYDTYLSGVAVLLKQLDVPINKMTDNSLRDCVKSYVLENQRAFYRKFAVSDLLDFLGKYDVRSELAMIKPRQPRRKLIKKDISFSQIKKLVEGIDDIYLKLIIMMQYDSSSRIGAVLKTQENLFGTDDTKSYVTLVEKRGYIRTVYLSKMTDELHQKLKASYKFYAPYQLTFEELYKRAGVNKLYIDKKRHGIVEYSVDEKIFSGKAWRNVYVSVYRMLKNESSKLLGFPLSSHWFRHSRIMHLYRSGYDMLDVQRFTGHKTLEGLKRYMEEAGMSNKEIMEDEEPKWK